MIKIILKINMHMCYRPNLHQFTMGQYYKFACNNYVRYSIM